VRWILGVGFEFPEYLAVNVLIIVPPQTYLIGLTAQKERRHPFACDEMLMKPVGARQLEKVLVKVLVKLGKEHKHEGFDGVDFMEKMNESIQNGRRSIFYSSRFRFKATDGNS